MNRNWDVPCCDDCNDQYYSIDNQTIFATSSSSTVASDKSLSASSRIAKRKSSTLPSTPSVILSSPSSIPYPSWHNAVSGGIAGAGSRIATAPLDLIRIRRQLMSSVVTYPSPSLYQQMRSIIQNEGGIQALYRGNLAAVYLWISYAGVQFSVFNSTKDVLRNIQHESCNANQNIGNRLIHQIQQSPTAISFIAGAWAGVCATTITYPFDVCRTTFVANNMVGEVSTRPLTNTSLHYGGATSGSQQSSKAPRTFYEFITRLYHTKGIQGFYAGCFPAVIQIMPYMGINFAIYDWLTRPKALEDDRNNTSHISYSSSTSVLLSAYAGSISGSVSKIIVYPLDTVKRRLQAQAFFGTSIEQPHYYTSMLDCFYSITKHEGLVSFYRGIFPSVLKTTISTALTFALYRFTKNVLEGIYDLQRLTNSRIDTALANHTSEQISSQ
jgi:solute carrier family 25 (mitochondrial thiamine pyrophosphate transporter), member 19